MADCHKVGRNAQFGHRWVCSIHDKTWGLCEVDTLRSELAAVKAENLAMREALKRVFTLPMATAIDTPHYQSVGCPRDVWREFVRQADAALTPPKSEKPKHDCGHPTTFDVCQFCEAGVVPVQKPKCVCDHMENQHTSRSPIGLLGCASCSCLAYEVRRGHETR